MAKRVAVAPKQRRQQPLTLHFSVTGEKCKLIKSQYSGEFVYDGNHPESINLLSGTAEMVTSCTLTADLPYDATVVNTIKNCIDTNRETLRENYKNFKITNRILTLSVFVMLGKKVGQISANFSLDGESHGSLAWSMNAVIGGVSRELSGTW